MKKRWFVKKTDMAVPVEDAFAWHERPGALERLTPPWVSLKNIRKSGGIETGATVKMDLAFPGFSLETEAEHTGYVKNTFFQDRMLKGPFKHWVHTHLFQPRGATGSFLEDRIEYQLPIHLPPKGIGMVEKELHRMFSYRHAVMNNDLEAHKKGKSPLTIVISGAGGPVGKALIPFFTTGGHRVIRLVRRPPKGPDEIFWNPYRGVLDLAPAGKIDVVINLNGYHIASGRWSPRRKEQIIQSRNLSTALIAKTILGLGEKPELFISASATGYYGDLGETVVNDACGPGDLFISRVCADWEQAAEMVEGSGIRTVYARIGVVLSPNGGILEKLVPPFLMGLGASIASGEQYLSWISMDDLIYAMHHVINDPRIHGPVNFVSPHPVTNAEFTDTMGEVLHRPTPFRVPAWAVKLAWGKMGQEVLLASTRVKPEKLMLYGYPFKHRTLDRALAHVMGKKKHG
ncbi:hypothetical protein SAMN02746065_11744 [Desulfocicer vacuolatum DSM 3385]|uniref:Uncharacterized protein n=1 Tax=Desulfocicer vacuolatum DSM 3385 TaxID=1121400 RepID=A0A1W2DET9_9BACT|nr:TIGR01777 family oxidoreductase [Desulfocicer vacuolatum]SMC96030.1 hypothetical protein SAMN02746065_11744 [Desulfocicer vacuolatum DSM 3385]